MTPHEAILKYLESQRDLEGINELADSILAALCTAGFEVIKRQAICQEEPKSAISLITSRLQMFIVLLQNPMTEEPYKAFGPFETEATARECEQGEAAKNSGWARTIEVKPWRVDRS